VDHCFAVELRGLQQTVFLLPQIEGVQLSVQSEIPPTVCISAPPFSLMRLLLQPETPLTSHPEIHIQGDIAQLQRLLSIFKQLNLDLEEHFARWLGDVPAHQMGNAWRSVQHYGQERWQTVADNFSEYLQEETKQLPAAAEVDTFLNEVDTLRDDSERLAQRIHRLHKSLL
jgi:ubiquinone biosynthesis protein UbiJ